MRFFTFRKSVEFVITVIDDRAIAISAIIGFKNPAIANGMATIL